MNPGKLWTPVLKRSVHNIINDESSKSAAKLRMGEDAADFFVDEAAMLTASAAREDISPDAAYYAVNNALNNIYAAFGVPSHAVVNLSLRKYEEEKELKQWIRNINAACEDAAVRILGGHTSVSAANEHTILAVTAIGRKRFTPLINVKRRENDYSGYRIIMTRPAGIEGTRLLIKKKQDILRRIYSKDFLNSINSCHKISIKEECDVIWKYIDEFGAYKAEAVPVMHDISEGGILAALWELGEHLGCGLEINMEMIPLGQVTVEVCEVLDINPYMLMTCGSLLIVTNESDVLLSRLYEKRIPAADIGMITDKNGRILKIGNETRFIEPFRGDSIYRGE